MKRLALIALLAAAPMTAASAAPTKAPRRTPGLHKAGKAPGHRAASSKSKREPTKVQRFIFGEDEVRANRATGGGPLITIRKRAAHDSMIHPRINFFPELIKTAEHI